MKKEAINIINEDGECIYFGVVYDHNEINNYFNLLLNTVNWQPEVIVMFGKEITTKRKVAFYGEEAIEYTYSNKTKKSLLWNGPFLDIKNKIEQITETSYNACLLNLYHDGNEGMGWHSDDEKEIVPNSSITSMSFGAERKFSFKHKSTKETVSVMLENGSLLEMKGTIQQHWLHQLPKTTKVSSPRINLTFRQMIQ